MWNLSRSFTGYDTKKVYIGSFWDRPLNPTSFKDLLAEDMLDLFEVENTSGNSILLMKMNFSMLF
jgi:hypothetical protein